MAVLEPKIEDFPRIRKALKAYMVTSVVTGIMLLLLCAVMVMKYAFGVELFVNTPQGAFHFYPTIPLGQEEEFVREGFNLFKAILIAHGWFYVVYLISNFMLWSPMRWPFWRFLLLALGGVIPFLSFFLEGRTAKQVNAYLEKREAAVAA
ncbi:DUF3817 domain-containing protein [Leucobacter sp. UCMA 4100]|uniref:DUF3817 domain-containing protein n=1 Tax=Leucobacter TaxID=55968 RepID=UPI001C210797|nr:MULTISPECIES: DUF3817 domain-containing protein [Leucobacter]MDA3146166.1 DUF3817 domain-containing protein [Leucobacter sp. UCMA 4100]